MTIERTERLMPLDSFIERINMVSNVLSAVEVRLDKHIEETEALKIMLRKLKQQLDALTVED